MKLHVSIQWTETAGNLLLGLPGDIGRGIARKVGDLQETDPRQAGKALLGPLQGYRSMTHGRYRVVFSVDEEPSTSGVARLHVNVVVVAVGIRRDRDRRDVYRVTQKLVEMGIIPKRGDG